MARITVYLSQPLEEAQERKLHRKICRAFPGRKIKLLQDHSYYKKLVLEADGELDPDELRRTIEQAGHAITGIDKSGIVQLAVQSPTAVPTDTIREKEHPLKRLHWIKRARMIEPDAMLTPVRGIAPVIGISALAIVMSVLEPIMAVFFVLAIVLMASLSLQRTEFTVDGWTRHRLWSTKTGRWSDYDMLYLVRQENPRRGFGPVRTTDVLYAKKREFSPGKEIYENVIYTFPETSNGGGDVTVEIFLEFAARQDIPVVVDTITPRDMLGITK